MKAREIIKLLEDDGWVAVRQRGSHRAFRHPNKPGTIIVPVHQGKDLHPDTVRSISPSGLEKLMREYAVVYEQGENNWSAYVPDLPGCVSVGDNRSAVEQNIRDAIELYIEVTLEHGESVPEPSADVGRVAVAV